MYEAPEVLSTARPFCHPLGADGLNTPSTTTAAIALRIAEVKKVLTGRGAASSLPVGVGATRLDTILRRANTNASSWSFRVATALPLAPMMTAGAVTAVFVPFVRGGLGPAAYHRCVSQGTADHTVPCSTGPLHALVRRLRRLKEFVAAREVRYRRSRRSGRFGGGSRISVSTGAAATGASPGRGRPAG